MKISQYPTRPLQFVLGVDSEGRASKNVPGGPVGPAPTMIGGTISIGAYDIEVVSEGLNVYRIDLTLPPPVDGITPTLVGGSVTTLPPGTPASAVFSPTGNPNEYELDLAIPAGQNGLDGTGTVNGPATSTVDYLVRWNSTNGTVLKEGIPLNAAGGVQGYSAKTAAIAALTWASDTIAYLTGASTVATTPFTSLARTLLGRTTNTQLRSDIGVIIGTDVQAYSAKTAAIAALTWANDTIAYFSGASTVASTAFTSLARTILGRTTGAQIRSDINAEELGKLATINTQTASYTAALSDLGGVVEMNVASANDFTVPPNSTVAFPINTRIDLVQYGAGQTTIVAGAGVTIRSEDAKLKLTKQYSGVSLYKRGTDEWIAVGSLVA